MKTSEGRCMLSPSVPEKDLMIYTTKAGCARGGGYHLLNDEYVVVIEGTVNILLDDKWMTLKKGMSVFIPHNTIHMMVAETDCIMMEWGVTKEEKNTVDETTRNYVKWMNMPDKR